MVDQEIQEGIQEYYATKQKPINKDLFVAFTKAISVLNNEIAFGEKSILDHFFVK